MQPISIACFNQDVWIRVSGRGNFQSSFALKQLVQETINKGYVRYVIDLKECDQLDSTFMGTVTGIAQRLRQYPESDFKVVNVNNSNQELMENLGLDELFSIQPLSIKQELPPDINAAFFATSSCSISPTEEKAKIQELVISAHESLMAANKGNAEKFKTVFEICSHH